MSEKMTKLSRPVDSLGRIVIPKGIRRALDIKPKDTVQLYIEGNTLIFSVVALNDRKAGEEALGIFKDVDSLGRIVIPKEIREALEIKTKTRLEVSVDKDAVLMKVYDKGCVFCGDEDGAVEFNGRKICGKCIKAIVELERAEN